MPPMRALAAFRPLVAVGPLAPVTINAKEWGRAKNRRVASVVRP
jgi:hypothetical protein